MRIARPAALAAALPLAAAVTVGAPAAIAAAGIATDRPCYRPGERVAVTLRELPALETVDVRVDDDVAAEVALDASGAGVATVTAPRGRPPAPVTLRAQISLEVLAETTFRLAVPVVEMSPTRARPTTRVRYTASGFPRAGPVYVHVVRGGRRLRTVRLGRPRRACDPVSARIAQIPVPRPRRGSYVLQFDQSRTYRARRAGAVVRRRVVR